jgi:hypothetical protein
VQTRRLVAKALAAAFATFSSEKTAGEVAAARLRDELIDAASWVNFPPPPHRLGFFARLRSIAPGRAANKQALSQWDDRLRLWLNDVLAVVPESAALPQGHRARDVARITELVDDELAKVETERGQRFRDALSAARRADVDADRRRIRRIVLVPGAAAAVAAVLERLVTENSSPGRTIAAAAAGGGATLVATFAVKARTERVAREVQRAVLARLRKLFESLVHPHAVDPDQPLLPQVLGYARRVYDQAVETQSNRERAPPSLADHRDEHLSRIRSSIEAVAPGSPLSIELARLDAKEAQRQVEELQKALISFLADPEDPERYAAVFPHLVALLDEMEGSEDLQPGPEELP